MQQAKHGGGVCEAPLPLRLRFGLSPDAELLDLAREAGEGLHVHFIPRWLQ